MADIYESWKNWISGIMETAYSPFQSLAPELTTSSGSSSLFGTKPENPGYTSTGGRRRRHRKTRKHRH